MDFSNRLDISNLIFRFVVPVVGCIAAAMVTVYIMQEINPLAAFCACASMVFFVMAAIAPRVGFFILLLLCAYSDLLKRLLVFWGDLSFEQVSYVLAGAPVVVGGLTLGMFTRWAFHRVQIQIRDLLFFVGIAIAAALNFLLAKRGAAGTLDAIKEAANNALYLVLTPVTMKLLENREQIGAFLMRARVVFIPVALYGIFQSIFGLADFEIEYLKSGLTIMVKELWDVRPRPFSTLNSAHALGTIMAAFAVLALFPVLIKGKEPLTWGQRAGSIAIFVLFLLASLVSLARTAIIVWVVALIAFWAFRSRRGTRYFYTSAVAVFISLIASASFVLDNIAAWDPANDVQSPIIGQAVRIQTYVERLRGFQNLTRSTEMYSLFGLPEEKKMTEYTYNHDPISALLVDFGIMGVLASATVVFFGLRFVHRRLLAIPEGVERDTVVLLTAVNVGWLTSHLLFHGVISTFPCNAFIWLFNGMIGWILLEAKSSEEPKSEALPVDRERLGLPTLGGVNGPALTPFRR